MATGPEGAQQRGDVEGLQVGAKGASAHTPATFLSFAQLKQIVEESLRSQCPVHCELVAQVALQDLGFGESTATLDEARFAYLQTHCANEFGVQAALALFGLASVSTTFSYIETEGRGYRATYRDTQSGNSLVLEFKRDDKGKALKLDIEHSSRSSGEPLLGDGNARMRELQLLSGFARDAMGNRKEEVANYPTVGALIGSRLAHQLASSVFWSKVEQGNSYHEALKEYAASEVIDADNREAYGFFSQPARYLRKHQDGIVKLARGLAAQNSESVISNSTEAARVAALAVEFREGRFSFPHAVVVPDGENPRYIPRVRKPGLLEPVQAIVTREKLQRVPIDTLLKPGTSDTGPDEWKPALREFLNGLPSGPERERGEKIIRFLVDGFFPYVDRTPGDQLTGEALVERYVRPFMTEGAQITFSYYYGFFKSQSPLRTGSRSSHIGPAEFEMLRNLAESAHTANERLGVKMRFVVVDELSAFSEFEPQYRLGYKPIEVTENHRRAHRYLESIGAEDTVLLRHFPDDLRLALGEREFDRLWYEQRGKTDRATAIPDHRIHILISCLPYEDLRSLGMSRDEIINMYANHLMGKPGRENYPARVIDIVAEAAVRFDALMKLRPVATEIVHREGRLDPPEFSTISAPIGVTHQGTRLSINPIPRFSGNATLPLHGIPVYEKGEMCGCVPLWKALRSPELFTAYVNPRGEPLWFEYRLQRAAVEGYLRSQGAN